MKIATAIIESEQASTKVTTQTLATDVSALDTAIGQLDVHSQEAYSSMESMISQAKALKKRIKEHFEDHVEQAHRAWKGLTAARKAQIDPLDAVIKQGEQKLGGYIARMRQAEAEERAIPTAIHSIHEWIAVFLFCGVEKLVISPARMVETFSLHEQLLLPC